MCRAGVPGRCAGPNPRGPGPAVPDDAVRGRQCPGRGSATCRGPLARRPPAPAIPGTCVEAEAVPVTRPSEHRFPTEARGSDHGGRPLGIPVGGRRPRPTEAGSSSGPCVPGAVTAGSPGPGFGPRGHRPPVPPVSASHRERAAGPSHPRLPTTTSSPGCGGSAPNALSGPVYWAIRVVECGLAQSRTRDDPPPSERRHARELRGYPHRRRTSPAVTVPSGPGSPGWSRAV